MTRLCHLDQCSSGQDFIREVRKSDKITKQHWAGDHLTVWGPNGRLTLANSKYEYPPFVRRKIVREVIAIGLTLLVLAVAMVVMT